MTSIIKVDQIQNAAGGTRTLNSLGLSALTRDDIPITANFQTQCAFRNSNHTLAGDSGWVDHLSTTFTVTRANTAALFIYSSSSSFESGPVQGFARFMLDGTLIGFSSCVAKQSTANAAGSGTLVWDIQALSVGQHTITVQIRNTVSGSTWVTPYYNEGSTANVLAVTFYGK